MAEEDIRVKWLFAFSLVECTDGAEVRVRNRMLGRPDVL